MLLSFCFFFHLLWTLYPSLLKLNIFYPSTVFFFLKFTTFLFNFNIYTIFISLFYPPHTDMLWVSRPTDLGPQDRVGRKEGIIKPHSSIRQSCFLRVRQSNQAPSRLPKGGRLPVYTWHSCWGEHYKTRNYACSKACNLTQCSTFNIHSLYWLKLQSGKDITPHSCKDQTWIQLVHLRGLVTDSVARVLSPIHLTDSYIYISLYKLNFCLYYILC